MSVQSCWSHEASHGLPAPCFSRSASGFTVATSAAPSMRSANQSQSTSAMRRHVGPDRRRCYATVQTFTCTCRHRPAVGMSSLQGRASGVMACWYTKADRQPGRQTDGHTAVNKALFRRKKKRFLRLGGVFPATVPSGSIHRDHQLVFDFVYH